MHFAATVPPLLLTVCDKAFSYIACSGIHVSVRVRDPTHDTFHYRVITRLRAPRTLCRGGRSTVGQAFPCFEDAPGV